jgi:hypothetical protein
MLIELRIGADGADGDDGEDRAAMTVMPGSTHRDTGETIIWHAEEAISQVDGAILKRTVLKIAVGAVLLRRYPAKGRHDFWLTVDGYLTRRGWDEGERKDFADAVARAAGDEEPKDRVRVGSKTEAKLAQGRKCEDCRRCASCSARMSPIRSTRG